MYYLTEFYRFCTLNLKINFGVKQIFQLKESSKLSFFYQAFIVLDLKRESVIIAFVVAVVVVAAQMSEQSKSA